MGTGCFSGRGVNHPPPSSAEVEETVELYIYSPLDLEAFYLVIGGQWTGGQSHMAKFIAALLQLTGGKVTRTKSMRSLYCKDFFIFNIPDLPSGYLLL
jgi:hypothetical protein